MPYPSLPSNPSRLLCGLGTFNLASRVLSGLSPANVLACCPCLPPQRTSASSNKSGMQVQGFSPYVPNPNSLDLKTSLNATSEKSLSKLQDCTEDLSYPATPPSEFQ